MVLICDVVVIVASRLIHRTDDIHWKIEVFRAEIDKCIFGICVSQSCRVYFYCDWEDEVEVVQLLLKSVIALKKQWNFHFRFPYSLFNISKWRFSDDALECVCYPFPTLRFYISGKVLLLLKAKIEKVQLKLAFSHLICSKPNRLFNISFSMEWTKIDETFMKFRIHYMCRSYTAKNRWLECEKWIEIKLKKRRGAEERAMCHSNELLQYSHNRSRLFSALRA